VTESTPEPINAADVLADEYVIDPAWELNRSDAEALNLHEAQWLIRLLLAHGNGATEGPVVTIHADGTLHHPPTPNGDDLAALRFASRAIRGASWPLEMGESVDRYAAIIDRLTGEAP